MLNSILRGAQILRSLCFCMYDLQYQKESNDLKSNLRELMEALDKYTLVLEVEEGVEKKILITFKIDITMLDGKVIKCKCPSQRQPQHSLAMFVVQNHQK